MNYVLEPFVNQCKKLQTKKNVSKRLVATILFNLAATIVLHNEYFVVTMCYDQHDLLLSNNEHVIKICMIYVEIFKCCLANDMFGSQSDVIDSFAKLAEKCSCCTLYLLKLTTHIIKMLHVTLDRTKFITASLTAYAGEIKRQINQYKPVGIDKLEVCLTKQSV